jgi:tRNA modification GTPase
MISSEILVLRGYYFPVLVEDTIAAIATALGEAALSVIRVSGPDALIVVSRCFLPAGASSRRPSEAATHTLHYGHIVHDGRRIDEALVAVMRAPRTFTREDVVEITCHGGPVPARSILDAVLASGARLASPGEFTRRAFVNGRIDLTQAEAIMDLIQSRTQLAMMAASDQLSGSLSKKVDAIRDSLMRNLAHVEAYIDFPEEDITPETNDALASSVSSAILNISGLLSAAEDGRALRRGVRVAIIGRPNAGKSSLLNQLLGHERAIVSPAPGTTRDTIEELASIHGIPLLLVDTAGLRDHGDDIELEGMRRARAALERAELVLHVLDSSEPLHEADRAFLRELENKKRITALNKADLPHALDLPQSAGLHPVSVSCETGDGIPLLRETIRKLVWSGQIEADNVEAMINSRHQDALSRALAALERARGAVLSRAASELAAEDLRIAVNAIGEITGQTATEDLLDVIFKQFCIGK